MGFKRMSFEMYTPYARAAGMILPMNGMLTIGTLESLRLLYSFDRFLLSNWRQVSRNKANVAIFVVFLIFYSFG